MNWVQFRSNFAVHGARLFRRLENLPLGVEILLFAILTLIGLAVRGLMMDRLPTYVWSKDAYSYSYGAFHWLDTGTWKIDGRRGPVYTIFLSFATRLWGNFDGVMIVQHLLGLLAILFTILCVRLYLGRRSAWIVYACGYALCTYGAAMYYGHLVRTEALLFVLATFAVGAWSLALKFRSATWLALAGLMAGLLTLTKNVFLPFPVMALGGVIYLFWRTPLRAALHALALLAAFSLPFALYSWHNHTADWVDQPQPQSGVLLWGRTAQWTVLDGGIEPEIKAFIRADIEEYRTLEKLDNNIIVNRTAVPHLKAYFFQHGRTPSELNQVCRRFAFEAIAAHPREFLHQAFTDFGRMQLEFGADTDIPTKGDLRNSANTLSEVKHSHPSLQFERNLALLEKAQKPGTFSLLSKVQHTAWLFQFFPTLLTSICLIWLSWRSRGQDRLLWLTQLSLWAFTMVLLSTIGRPMNRYLIPVTPVMFWTLTATLSALAQALSSRLAPAPVPVPTSPHPASP